MTKNADDKPKTKEDKREDFQENGGLDPAVYGDTTTKDVTGTGFGENPAATRHD